MRRVGAVVRRVGAGLRGDPDRRQCAFRGLGLAQVPFDRQREVAGVLGSEKRRAMAAIARRPVRHLVTGLGPHWGRVLVVAHGGLGPRAHARDHVGEARRERARRERAVGALLAPLDRRAVELGRQRDVELGEELAQLRLGLLEAVQPFEQLPPELGR